MDTTWFIERDSLITYDLKNENELTSKRWGKWNSFDLTQESIFERKWIWFMLKFHIARILTQNGCHSKTLRMEYPSGWNVVFMLKISTLKRRAISSQYWRNSGKTWLYYGGNSVSLPMYSCKLLTIEDNIYYNNWTNGYCQTGLLWSTFSGFH